MSLDFILRMIPLRLILSEIGTPTNDKLIIGYIRTHCMHFPSVIINYILLYLFYVVEEWDTTSNFGRIQIHNTNMLTKSKWLASWHVLYIHSLSHSVYASL